jgi:hypothetical protein
MLGIEGHNGLPQEMDADDYARELSWRWSAVRGWLVVQIPTRSAQKGEHAWKDGKRGESTRKERR